VEAGSEAPLEASTEAAAAGSTAARLLRLHSWRAAPAHMAGETGTAPAEV
jgi:hypothetical protein